MTAAVGPEGRRDATLARVASMSALDLAARAVLAPPLAEDGPGAAWLLRLRDEAVAAVVGYLDDDAPVSVGARRWQLDHAPALLADECGPAEPSDAWAVVLDLGLWRTPVELLALDGMSDLTEVARGVLYLAALAVGQALAALLTEDPEVLPR